MSKRIALTFDDGPQGASSTGVTTQVLDILKENNVRATFFVVGQNVAANTGLVQRAVAEGHLLGNHTYSHPWDTAGNGVYSTDFPPGTTRIVTSDMVKDEVQKANDAINAALLPREYVPRFFRAPQGKYWGPGDERTWLDDATKPLGFVVPPPLPPFGAGTSVGWDVDDMDWDSSVPAETAANNILSSSAVTSGQDGTIVLCHDHWSNDPAAMKIVIPTLKNNGWEFVTIDDLYGCKDTLRAGEYLIPGQCIQSENDAYRLIYQADGNLVLYQTSDGEALWAANSNGPAWRFYMQGDDGNIVVYESQGNAVWASNVYGPQYAGSILLLLNNGNLEVQHGTQTIWRAIYGSGLAPDYKPQTSPGV